MPLYVLLGCFALYASLFVAASDFEYDSSLAWLSLTVAGYTATGAVLRSYGVRRLGGAFEASAIFTAVALSSMLLSALLLSTNMPLADPLLAKVDAMLFFGFDRHSLVAGRGTWSFGWEMAIWSIYQSFSIQPYLLILLLFTIGRGHEAWTFILAWAIALTASVLISPLVPALGSPPYAYEFESTFHGIRNGSLRDFGTSIMTGLITFPSFHAVAAVLLGATFWRIRGVNYFFVPLNAAMLVSALFIGGHYMIDLVAGVALATAALPLAKRIQTRIGLESSSDLHTT